MLSLSNIYSRGDSHKKQTIFSSMTRGDGGSSGRKQNGTPFLFNLFYYSKLFLLLRKYSKIILEAKFKINCNVCLSYSPKFYGIILLLFVNFYSVFFCFVFVLHFHDFTFIHEVAWSENVYYLYG